MTQNSNIKKKVQYLGKNSLLFGLSSFGTKFLSFLLVPLYTNVLSTAEYGTADIISATSTLLIYILTINVEEGILRYVIDRKDEHTNILSYGFRVLSLGTIICTTGLMIVYFLNILNWPIYYYGFILAYFFFTAFYQIMLGYLRGLEKIHQVAIAGIISALSMIVSNIICLLIVKIGITGYLLSHVLGVLFGGIYCIIVSREPVKTYFINTCDKKLSNEIRAYCTPLIFNNIALWINAFLDRFFVTAICGISESGIYSMASKIPTILATCYSVFSQAWNLTAMKEFDPNDSDGFFSKTYSIYNAITCFACSVLILINVPLAKFLYAKEFFEAWRYSSILLLFVMFNSLTIFLSSIFNAVKDTKIIAKTTIISAAINTLLNTILIPMWGTGGAAIATALSYLFMWIIRIIACNKYLNLKINYIRDIVTYIILTIQVVFEHIEGHFYIGQIICIIVVTLFQGKKIFCIINNIKFMIIHIVKR